MQKEIARKLPLEEVRRRTAWIISGGKRLAIDQHVDPRDTPAAQQRCDNRLRDSGIAKDNGWRRDIRGGFGHQILILLGVAEDCRETDKRNGDDRHADREQRDPHMDHRQNMAKRERATGAAHGSTPLSWASRSTRGSTRNGLRAIASTLSRNDSRSGAT